MNISKNSKIKNVLLDLTKCMEPDSGGAIILNNILFEAIVEVITANIKDKSLSYDEKRHVV